MSLKSNLLHSPTRALAALRLKLRAAVTLPPGRLAVVVKTRLFAAASAVQRQLRRKIGIYSVRAIERTFGSDLAHQLYWRLSPSVQGWNSTERRLGLLGRENPSAIPEFVRLGLYHSNDLTMLVGLARHPLSQSNLAESLSKLDLSKAERINARVTSSQQYSAGLIAVAGGLLEPEAAKAFARAVVDRQNTITPAFFQIIDSFGYRPAIGPCDLYVRGLLESGYRQPVAHRLVIIENFQETLAISHLFAGARKVTLLVLSDTFGRTDMTPYIVQNGVEEIVVEHIRTRVPRFSEAYIRIHEDSRKIAELLEKSLSACPDLLPGDQAAYVTVAIADFLHFQSLKIASVEALLADPGFDHIVIGTANHVRGSEYLQLLSGVRGLVTDPRVEVVSASHSVGPRTQFASCLYTLKNPQKSVDLTPDWAVLNSSVLFDLEKRAASLAKLLPTLAAGKTSEGSKASLSGSLIFTSNNPAYNSSTAQYASALSQIGPVTLMHVGLRAEEMQEALFAISPSAAAIPIIPLPTQPAFWAKSALLWMVMTLPNGHPDSPAAHIARVTAGRLAREVVEPLLLLGRALNIWFDQLEKTASLPGLVVLSPARAPQVGIASAVARRHGVPSLTLEAHGLNANYSRYLKVTTDFYGVVSEYFRQLAVEHFDIPADRVSVIGSPRIIAPMPYNPGSARTAARADLGQNQGVKFDGKGTLSFFCQPSAWDHVSCIWRNILMAAQTLGMTVLLKPHPEENQSRVAAYLSLAAEVGMAKRVYLVGGPANPVIAASDVVLTAYSAAALDAAVLRVPVICVTEGDIDYPVDQHLMIGAPLVRTMAELQSNLAEILADPKAAEQKASQFLEREVQFVEGPDVRLQRLVAEITARPISTRVRLTGSLSPSIFLDGPHPVFPV